jgi:DNA-binding protein Fis
MDFVISQDYAEAASANALHNRNRNRWNFLLNSYVGGDDYKRGNYLTRYQLESENEYAQRLQVTPLDNQCRSIIATYISFMFRQSPSRDFGTLITEPSLQSFLEDADWEGRDLDSFMKQASIYANIFGHSWIVMSKPDVGAVTRADEMAQGVRPYLNLMTPLAVTDWKWARRLNGSYELAYLKYVEDANDTITVIKEWTKETVTTTTLNHDKEVIADRLTELNGLGQIPAVIMYAHTSPVRGIGLSTINDIADTQKFIFNMLSEAEQATRLGGHPSLVKTAATNAGTGAGSIIEMPEHLDPALKPYVLEFNGQEISSIYTAINQAVESIDKMANTGSVRATEAKMMSGVAREVEFQLLNARLSEQASNIELAEEQLWQLYAAYQMSTWDGEIEYPNSFAIRDTQNDIDQLSKVYDKVTNPLAKLAIEHEMLELVDIEYNDIVNSESSEEETEAGLNDYVPHIMQNPTSAEEVTVLTEDAHNRAIANGFTVMKPLLTPGD